MKHLLNICGLIVILTIPTTFPAAIQDQLKKSVSYSSVTTFNESRFLSKAKMFLQKIKFNGSSAFWGYNNIYSDLVNERLKKMYPEYYRKHKKNSVRFSSFC